MPRGRLRVPLPVEDQRELVERYLAGETLEALRRRYRIATVRIRRALVESGVEIRRQAHVAKPLSDSESRMIVAEYKAGLGACFLADRYRISLRRVKTIILAAGLQFDRHRTRCTDWLIGTDPDDENDHPTSMQVRVQTWSQIQAYETRRRLRMAEDADSRVIRGLLANTSEETEARA